MFNLRRSNGFTLLEILVALFIFTILSMMLSGALSRVISAHERTEYKAKQLRDLQMALLVFSRDIEQAVNRPGTDASGKEIPALTGGSRDIQFTHTGRASLSTRVPQSTLVRVQYSFSEQKWWRKVWQVLDQAPQTRATERPFLSEVVEGRFEYLDKQGHFHNEWRGSEDLQEPLPRAIRLTIKLARSGQLSQLYLISADESEQSKQQPHPDESKPAPKEADDA